MNKQFDLFVKMKIKELSENISRMTYAYINPDTNQPTVVPAKHYKEILDQPVEDMVNDQVKKAISQHHVQADEIIKGRGTDTVL